MSGERKDYTSFKTENFYKKCNYLMKKDYDNKLNTNRAQCHAYLTKLIGKTSRQAVKIIWERQMQVKKI